MDWCVVTIPWEQRARLLEQLLPGVAPDPAACAPVLLVQRFARGVIGRRRARRREVMRSVLRRWRVFGDSVRRQRQKAVLIDIMAYREYSAGVIQQRYRMHRAYWDRHLRVSGLIRHTLRLEGQLKQASRALGFAISRLRISVHGSKR